MRNSLNNSNITYFPLRDKEKNTKNKKLIIDKKKLDEFGFLVLKNFGDSSEKLKNFIIGQGYNLFYSEKLDGWLHTFETKIDSSELSEELESGGFHTDFMFQKKPPRYIALQCIKADPKYPFYGRNQIVKIDHLINEFIKFGIKESEFRELEVEYFLNGEIYKQKLFDSDFKNIKYHQKFAINNIILKNNIKIIELINNVSLSVCSDFVLNSGDLLIIDNYTTLHRRSECSVKYDDEREVFESRKMNSVRFD